LERELAAAKEKVAGLLKVAAEKAEQGFKDSSEELKEQAARLIERIEQEHAKQQERLEEWRDDAARKKALNDLERAVGVLRELGRDDQAAALQKTLRETEQRFDAEKKRDGDAVERRAKGEVRGEDLGRPENLKQELEVLRIAHTGLREGAKGDAAELVERAIHARELLLEQRNDEKARRIIEKAPSRQQLAKALRMSAKLWMGYGNEEKANAVANLADRFAPLKEKGKELPDEGKKENDKEGNRVQQLENRIKRLEGAIKELLQREK
jgi:hypothetical protein